jgi:2-methylisocitrate lyase-like PEP mutase family enzyme
VQTPVIVDADTGFGNALNVMRTVRGFERAGAAMIQIEDQTFPKRCGHLDGKSVVGTQEMVGKLKAALDARQSGATLILARTDAVASEGLDKALERAEHYFACGVDALFIEALRTPEQMDKACKQFAHRLPLLANMVEGGKTPVQSATELAQRGFKIVIFPGGTVRAVTHTLQGYYASLQQNQTTAPWAANMLDFDGLNEVIGTPALLATGQTYSAARRTVYGLSEALARHLLTL